MPRKRPATKKDRRFAQIAEFKERFRDLPLDKLRERLSLCLVKEAAIAVRELIDEKEAQAACKEQR